MKAKVFQMRLVTNLHMGSGETNFNFIDNQVQRDPVTEYPNMHSSGIKGALREYFSGTMEAKYVSKIFGAGEDQDTNTQGSISFIEGKLLAIPVRSNKKSYYMGTTLGLLRAYIDFYNLFHEKKIDIDFSNITFKAVSDKAYVITDEKKGLCIESLEGNEIKFEPSLQEELEKKLGIQDIVIFEEEIFKEEVSKRLPVIARNCLENGVSKNLWYEEVVPRESVFYTAIINSQNIEEMEFDKFGKELEKNLIQIGANATIGYGFTKFIEVKSYE